MQTKESNFRDNLKLLFRTVGYVYQQNFWGSLTRDLSLFLLTFLEIYAIRVGGQFIDATAEILTEWDTFTVKEYFMSDSFFYLAIGLVIWITIGSFKNLRGQLKEKIARNVPKQAKLDMIDKISHENLQEVEHEDFQKMIAFVPTYSFGAIFNTYNTFSELLRQIIRTVSAFIILFQVIGPSVVLLLLISIPEPLVQYYGENKIRNYRLSQIEGIKKVSYLREIAAKIAYFSEIRVNGIYKYIRRSFIREETLFINGLVERFAHYFMDNTLFKTLGQVFFNGYVIYIIFVSVIKKLTIGEFKAMYDYANTCYNGGYNIVRKTFQLTDYVLYAGEFFHLIDYQGFGDVNTGTVKLAKETPTLRMSELDFGYPDDDHKVLENITLEIKPGSKVAVVGGDGSGKSTFVKILCGLYELQSGDYFFNDASVRELDRGELKSKISVVFQNFIRYDMTIEKNITISGEKVRLNQSLYDRVKKVADVDSFMKKEGMKDSQILGKLFVGGKEISPGYWQRLAIARMLYRNKDILVLDEPFTYIDGPSRLNILKSIIDFANNKKSIIFITRNTDNLKNFDNIYFLDAGKVVEEGDYKSLMKKRGYFYKSVKSNQ